MFLPYYCVEASDFAEVQKKSVVAADIEIEKYVDDFPVLDHLLFTSSPATHYHIVRAMVVKLTEIKNQDKQSRARDVLRYLIHTMPAYPDGMVRPLNDNTVRLLNDSSPELLSMMIVRNPAFGGNCENEVVKMSVSVGAILAERTWRRSNVKLGVCLNG